MLAYLTNAPTSWGSDKERGEEEKVWNVKSKLS